MAGGDVLVELLEERERVRSSERRDRSEERTAMNWSRGGGQAQGILMGWPLAPAMPSQSLDRKGVEYGVEFVLARKRTRCRWG